MKRTISTILAGFLALSCLTAQAAGRTASVSEKLSDKSEIHILYNDTVVKYDDVKPVNTDGRVMIPFRAALENMGATVDYNNDNRLVTAKKGDIEIKFTLMDDTIYIDKNGVQSTITMDVPMIIVSDRTLVPIRFMSNAFDMQVGWDGDTETVIILDYDDYANTINAAASNIVKMSELETPANIKGTADFDITFNTEGLSEKAINLSLSGKADSAKLENSSNSDITLNFSGLGAEVKDSKLSVLSDGDKVYVKTDLIEKLAPQMQDETLQNKMKLVASDKWYTVDLGKLVDSIAVPEESKAAFEAALTQDKPELTAMITNMTKTEGDATLDSAVALAAVTDVLEGMNKFVTVTEKDNGGYEAKMNITDTEFDNMLANIMGTVSEEDKKLIANMMNVVLNTNISYDGNKLDSDMLADISAEEAGVKLGLKMNIKESFIKDDKLDALTAPADSVDITDILIDALK